LLLSISKIGDFMKIRKAQDKSVPPGTKKEIKCILCNKTTSIVDYDVKRFKCSMCLNMRDPFIIQLLSGQGKHKEEKQKKTESNRKPRGWKFMKEFVDKEGNVYHKGVEQPELKGSLEPTEIIPKEKAPKESARVFDEIQREAFAKVNDYKNRIIAAYTQKETTNAHKLERELSAYKKEYRKYLTRKQ
jgi:pyruvate/2-oxoacid:ferredoxin oxidoreductase alpha subunit